MDAFVLGLEIITILFFGIFIRWREICRFFLASIQVDWLFFIQFDQSASYHFISSTIISIFFRFSMLSIAFIILLEPF